MLLNKSIFIIFFIAPIFSFECPDKFVSINDSCYYKSHLDVLQDFIDINESLINMNPQNLGTQAWEEGKLTYLYLGDHLLTTVPDSIGLLSDLIYLDLRENNLTKLPNGICELYPRNVEINLMENNICPPYPSCFNYISNQNKDACESAECPFGYDKLDDECFNKEHINVLKNIIKSNPSLAGLKPLEIGKEVGYQGWENGEIVHLALVGNGLIKIPEDFCTIFDGLKSFNLSNNNICPPYPSCIEYLGFQNVDNCEDSASDKSVIDNYKLLSQINDISSFNIANFYNDISILQDIVDHNEIFKGKDPLDIGRQQWENMRLISLDLSNRGLTKIPPSICNIYSNLSTFDISNNSITTPYPNCMVEREGKSIACEDEYILLNDDCYHSGDINVLIDFIQLNPSITSFHPLMLGYQVWKHSRLQLLYIRGLDIIEIPKSIQELDFIEYLDLNNNKLEKLPDTICNIYPQLISIDLTNNSICPPYPSCIEYLTYQETENCEKSSEEKQISDEIRTNREFISHPTNHSTSKIENFYYNISALQDLIESNPNLQGKQPLDIGRQQWENMRLVSLDLSDLGLTNLPSSICNIYSNLHTFDISNNSITTPYPDCIIDRENKSIACQDGYILFNNDCYHSGDIKVLIDFIQLNPSISSFHPLMLGYQVWKHSRLQLLYIVDLDIIEIPENIIALKELKYLDLNSNQLEKLPEIMCELYSQLTSMDLTNNLFCPPYLSCIDYMGWQNTKNCPNDGCPANYKKIDKRCYYEKDLAVLQDFIDSNVSLKGKTPLDIGIQEWKNMRLDFLYLGMNELTTIPESICEIYDNISSINLSSNKICSSYPKCVTQIIDDQDTSNCP